MSSRINGQISPQPCPHLAEFRRTSSKPFLSLHNCLRIKPPGGRASLRRDSHEIPHCTACGLSAPSRLYACISCAAVSCHSTATGVISHAAAHAASMSPGHQIAIDVDRAELFCCACRDQVYDRDFDAAVVIAQTVASTLGGGESTVIPTPHPENLRKRRRVDYRPSTPDLRERALIGSCSAPIDGSGRSPDFPRGLRGLNNLGNTCFMNSVLQALLHTPPLRNYFLSDKHNRYFCQKMNNADGDDSTIATTRKKSGGNNGNKNGRICLACDMDAMFSAVFSGDRLPYSPAKFLYSWWQHAAKSHLASYEQQDAHEFFISMLDGIHEKVDKDQRKPHSEGNGEGLGLLLVALGVDIDQTIIAFSHHNLCYLDGVNGYTPVSLSSGDCCIAHRVFSGILRSDVMCMACGYTSTTYDPCIDISLDLEPNQGGSTKIAAAASNHSCNGEADSSQNCGISTLTGCLDRFTRAEKLGSNQKFFCQQCQVKQETLKQMSIRKLPLVSCFHIKRFEHSSSKKMSRKVDRYLQFPFSLDMSPYLSSSILRSRFGNRIFPFDGDEPDASNDLCSEFELFAVVTHSGKLDAGHYVTYLRLSNQWYKCDDSWVTQVDENTVRAAQGYMMFYVQKMLYYKATDKLIAS